MKYSFIENHAYSLLKSIDKFWQLILGKHTGVRNPFPAVKFLLSQNFLSGKLAHLLTKIQEHDLKITTSQTTKGHDPSFHHAKDLDYSKEINF